MLRRYRQYRLRFVDNLPRYRVIAEMVGGGTVLDYGCGEGYLGRILQARGCDVTGCDISEQLLKRCPFPTHRLDLNKAADFADDQFDTVVSSDVLEHLRDPEAALGEMRRIARRQVVVSVPNSRDYLLYKILPSMENPHERYSPHLHHWSRRSFPYPDMPLLEFKYCTDIPELRFCNLVRLAPFSQTMVMKFDAAGLRGRGA